MPAQLQGGITPAQDDRLVGSMMALSATVTTCSEARKLKRLGR